MVTLTIQPFYLITIILICICALDIIYVSIVKPVYYNNKVKKSLLKKASKENINCQIYKNKTDGANFALKIDEQLYLIKVVYVPKKCEIQINNIDTFVVYTSTITKAMKAKTLANMSTFMKSKKPNRILILANKAKAVKKVINECEMIMVNDQTDIYKARLLNYNDYDLFFKK